MLSTVNNYTRQIMIFLIVFIAALVGYLFTQQNNLVSTLWPAVGFAAGYYVIFKKQSLLPILLAIFIAGILVRGFFIDESFFTSIFLTSISVASNMIVILLFNNTLRQSNDLSKVTAKNVGLWFLASIISPVFGALFSISIWYIVYPSNEFFQDFIRWSIGDSFGLLIFSSSVLLSYLYDSKKIDYSKSLISTSYIVLVIAISYVLFFVGDEALFHNFSYIYFVIFFTATFFFSFRTIILLSAVFVISFSLHLLDIGDNYSYITVLFRFNLFLFALATISSITKMVIYNLRQNNKTLLETNKELDKMIASTNSILQMSKVFMNEENEKDEDLLYQMFNIAKTIFHNYDYATCYMKQNGAIHFVDAVGYDADHLNRLIFDPQTFVFNKDDVEIIDQETFEKQIESELSDRTTEYFNKFPRVKSSVRFGIFLSDSVVGGMSFDQSIKYQDSFTKYDVENFDSFQKLMNGFYEINYLNSKNDKLKNDLVLSLVRTLELYDHYTGGHSEDVAHLSLELSKRMNLSKKDQYDIYWSGIVHDIGKVGIDVKIINKQGKLTPLEFEDIKKHPIHGYDILNRSDDLKRIALWVRSHHEWWNGEGYPDNIQKSEIPIGAQILCVADAVSSMATVRTYSKQKTWEEIKEELLLFKGIQFSPIVCDHMIEMIDDGFVSTYFNK